MMLMRISPDGIACHLTIIGGHTCPLCMSEDISEVLAPHFVPSPDGGPMTTIEVVIECDACGSSWAEVFHQSAKVRLVERVEYQVELSSSVPSLYTFKKEQDALDLANPETSAVIDQYESSEVTKMKFEPGAKDSYESEVVYKWDAVCTCGGSDPHCCPRVAAG